MLSLMSNEIQKNVRDKVLLKEEMYMKHDTEFLTHVVFFSARQLSLGVLKFCNSKVPFLVPMAILDDYN